MSLLGKRHYNNMLEIYESTAMLYLLIRSLYGLYAKRIHFLLPILDPASTTGSSEEVFTLRVDAFGGESWGGHSHQ